MCYMDRTYCSSPNCKNECGRQFTEEDKKGYEAWAATFRGNPPGIAYSNFCDEKGHVKK